MPNENGLVSETLVETVVNGFLQYDLTRVYQIFTSARTDGVGTVLSSSSLPPLGQPLLVNGVRVWCHTRNPVRVNTPETEKHWNVSCTFSNQTAQFERDANGNPTTDPTAVVPRLSISFQEVSEPITTARLKRISKEDGSQALGPPTMRLRAVEGLKGPITNSASQVIERERRAHRKVLRYSFYARDWNNSWDDLLDKTNSEAVTFTQTDVDGTRLLQTFAANTLLVADLDKDDVWREGKLFFRVTVVLLENKQTWTHFEPDKGDKRRIFENQYKADGTQFTLAEADAIGPYQVITTEDDDGNVTTVGEPVKLNGYGAEQPRERPGSYQTDENFFVEFEVYDSADIQTVLGLS